MMILLFPVDSCGGFFVCFQETEERYHSTAPLLLFYVVLRNVVIESQIRASGIVKHVLYWGSCLLAITVFETVPWSLWLVSLVDHLLT